MHCTMFNMKSFCSRSLYQMVNQLSSHLHVRLATCGSHCILGSAHSKLMVIKPLSWGHLAMRDKKLVPNGVSYRGVPL